MIKRYNRDMFDDIETCCTNAQTGSFLILSLRRNFDEGNIEDFKNSFIADVPSDLTKEDLAPKNSYKTIRKMFINKIDDVLSNLSASSEEGSKLVFRQLFNFTYDDNAKMYTFGGMIIENQDELNFDRYRFHSYDYVMDADDAYNISFPIITNKEYHELNKLLPSDKDKFLKQEQISFVPPAHRKNYFNTYKFYPAYIEIRDL